MLTSRMKSVPMERVWNNRVDGLGVYGYVVVPEHVHLLLNEPERATSGLQRKNPAQAELGRGTLGS